MKLTRGARRVGRAALRRGVLLATLAAALLLYWYVERRLVAVHAVRLPSGQLFLMEDARHPALRRFRREEGIDRIVAAGKDELGRLQALAKWTSQLFPATTPFPDYPPWDAAELLRLIREGKTGGFCAQYAFVFGQACQSLGYQVRYSDLIPSDGTDTHFVPEVYLPSWRRWVVFEPQHGTFYMDGDGTPLGVIDLHEFRTGLRAATVLEAPAGGPVAPGRIALFDQYRFFLRNNFLSVPAFYSLRHSGGRLYWLFERYRPVCTPREGGAAPGGRAEYDFTPDVDGAQRTMAFSAASFLAAACGEEDGRVVLIKAPAGVLRDVVRQTLSRDVEYHPLDGDRSWWPAPGSRSPLPGPKQGSGTPAALP